MKSFKDFVTESKKDIASVIRETVAEFIIEYGDDETVPVRNAYDINKGFCEDFADAVIEKMGRGATMSDLLCFADYDEETCHHTFTKKYLEKEGLALPKGATADMLNKIGLDHTMILYKGKYYDSECPEGVSSPFLLPLIAGNLRNSGLIK